MVGNFQSQKQHLLQELLRSGVHDRRVLGALERVPREQFVDRIYMNQAYDNVALPIQMEQTISQPLMVAVMTQALQLMGNECVLEIGTGSGYQTAILSQLANHVYSIERHPQLLWQAAQRLHALNVENVSLYVSDGSAGWPEQAPYDRIIVTAASSEIPEPLLAQLAPRGIMIIPVGEPRRQELLRVQNTFFGPRTTMLGGCVFVPLVHDVELSKGDEMKGSREQS
ncbi:MAG TPA: protein-L-isoaspartate O-methyltransferase [Ktedonobacter sp.]|nr:protein-L-isoaspartate O-methyltransferase [Ktedonobacter sp.]